MSGDSDKHIEKQPQEANPAIPPSKTGDTIAVNVGEGAAHVAAGKNIIQIGSLTVPRWAALLAAAALALITVLAGAVAVFTQQTGESTQRTAAILAYTPTATATLTPIPTPTLTPPPFAPAAAGETLIVLLPFHSTAATNSEVHVKIWRRIRDLLADMPDAGVTAVIDPNVALTADQRAEAEQIGKLHHASMVIWGEDTGVELIASFLNLREPEFDAAEVDIQETQRTQLANPSRYAEFITRDLPGQMAFLALFAVGQTYYLNNDYGPAIDMIDAAVAEVGAQEAGVEDNPAPAVAQGLAEAYFRLSWLQHKMAVDLKAALANYSRALELDPQNSSAYNNRGVVYADLGELAQALADYNQAIVLDPQNAVAYNNRGLAYREQGVPLRAIADYDQALALDSQFAVAYYNRGIAHSDQGDLVQAIADYSKAIELDPQNAEAYNNRGVAYSDRGDGAQAIADYSKAIELAPQHAKAYNNRGLAYRDQGDLVQAIADFGKALELDSQNAFAYNNRGTVYREQGDYAPAIADYDKALELDPEYAIAYFNRGLAWYIQGDLVPAIADYGKALELNPQDADVNNALCWMLALLQRAGEAMPYCETAVALVDDPSYHDSRGLAHALLGDYSAAAADFQVYADWLADYPEETALIEQRRAWIAALARGENPFTPAVLEELKGQ